MAVRCKVNQQTKCRETVGFQKHFPEIEQELCAFSIFLRRVLPLDLNCWLGGDTDTSSASLSGAASPETLYFKYIIKKGGKKKISTHALQRSSWAARGPRLCWVQFFSLWFFWKEEVDDKSTSSLSLWRAHDANLGTISTRIVLIVRLDSTEGSGTRTDQVFWKVFSERKSTRVLLLVTVVKQMLHRLLPWSVDPRLFFPFQVSVINILLLLSCWIQFGGQNGVLVFGSDWAAP